AETVSAMRTGHTHIRSTAEEPLRAKLMDIAGQLGVSVVEGTPAALDLRFTYYVANACREWLEAGMK
ncbi:MAG: hypothetical protein K2Q01_08470, partial [Rickettsiales bacterium]|nr:hypothetical protein [Rickettsiales bacterium]